MGTYLCHNCASRGGVIKAYSGIVNHDVPEDLVQTNYQLDKFLKHTIPNTQPGYISIFSDPQIESYANFTVSAAASGCVEFDTMGRLNLIVYAGRDNGFTLHDGTIQFPTDSTKLVLSHDSTKFHSYPVSAENYSIHKCYSCGKDVLG